MLQGVAWVLVVVASAVAVWLGLRLRNCHRAIDRLTAERELAHRTSRPFETIVAHAPRGLALLDVRGRVVTINQQALDLLGARRADFDGREFWSLTSWGAEATRSMVRHGCIDALAGNLNRLEIGATDAEGRQVQLMFQPLLDEAGIPSQILVEAEPRSYDAAAEANEARVIEVLAVMSQLATRIAHDINNPLAGIRNSFLLVRDAIPTNHPHFAFAAAIDREIERLATFSRRLHESFDLRPANDPRPTLRAAAMEAMLTIRQPTTPVTIDVELGPAARATASIPGLALQMLIGNVLQDLVDASPPGGTVSIRAGIVDDSVLITVTGATWRHPKMGVGARPLPGPGIALFRRFAEILGARIEVSNADDDGSEVLIQLPLASPPDPTVSPARSPLTSRASALPH